VRLVAHHGVGDPAQEAAEGDTGIRIHHSNKGPSALLVLDPRAGSGEDAVATRGWRLISSGV